MNKMDENCTKDNWYRQPQPMWYKARWIPCFKKREKRRSKSRWFLLDIKSDTFYLALCLWRIPHFLILIFIPSHPSNLMPCILCACHWNGNDIQYESFILCIYSLCLSLPAPSLPLSMWTGRAHCRLHHL